jgi:hypothetical protein
VEAEIEMIEKSVEIVKEDVGFRLSTVIGYIYDGFGGTCKFSLEMYPRELYWKLKVLQKFEWIVMTDFPKFDKGDYYNRIVINWLVANMDRLIRKISDHV